jgi:glucosamine-6-phosphate deaminase
MSNVIKTAQIDKLKVAIYRNRKELGKAAAMAVGQKIRELLSQKEEIRMVLAAAPSQNEILDEFVNMNEIEWSKITAFHMDEYIGLSPQAPQRFGLFLKNKIFDRVPFKQINYLNPESGDAQEECDRYSMRLKQNPIDIIVMGIGENGHIAFNDPPVADFDDPLKVKVVELDEKCRLQQVNDGCFKTIDEVPRKAITFTVPMLFSGKHLFIVVPGATKKVAVFETLYGKVSTQCPASVLRRHEDAQLYLDKDSAALLDL